MWFAIGALDQRVALDARVRSRYVPGVPTIVHGDFEWDADKALVNASKHGVTFEEAAVAMTDLLSIDFDDLEHSDRLITLATSPMNRILYVVTTEAGDRTRIISARRATNHERRIYEEGE